MDFPAVSTARVLKQSYIRALAREGLGALWSFNVLKATFYCSHEGKRDPERFPLHRKTLKQTSI